MCQDTSITPLFVETKGEREGTGALPVAPPSERRASAEPETLTPSRLIRRGAECALMHLCQQFGAQIWDELPILWTCAAEPLLHDAPMDDARGQALLDACSVLECIAPHVHTDLHESLASLLDALVRVSQNEFRVLRGASARCFLSLIHI